MEPILPDTVRNDHDRYPRTDELPFRTVRPSSELWLELVANELEDLLVVGRRR